MGSTVLHGKPGVTLNERKEIDRVVPFGSAARATIAGRRLGARLEEDTAAIATPTARR